MSHLLYHRSGHQYFIRPAATKLPELPNWVFDPSALREKKILTRTVSGRAHVSFFDYEGHHFVLRHYWRGGVAARITADRFIWTGIKRSRPWRELETVAHLRRLEMPVPNPVGARICKDRHGLLYTADIITTEIRDALPLPDFMCAVSDESESSDVWFAVGAVIAKLHAGGARHTDLNVRNILIDRSKKISVIDWDKGYASPEPRRHHRSAKQSLVRLHRSIKKEPIFKDSHQDIYAKIIDGYALFSPLIGSSAK